MTTTPPLHPPIDIAILALDGAVYSSIVGPMDVFSVANVLCETNGQQAFARVRVLKVGRRQPLSFNRIRIHTQDSIEEITWKVGYEDGSSFSRLFKKITGMPPGGYRKKFSLAVPA